METRHRISRPGRRLLCLGAVLLAGPAWAGDWKLDNSLQLNSYFSDNLGHRAQGNAGVGLIVRPQIGLQGAGRRVSGTLSYAPSLNTVFGEDVPDSRIAHQLAADFNAELVRQRLFLDASATAGLVTTSALAGSGDADLTTSDETRQTYGFSLSPYTVHRFGSYAQMVVRLGMNMVGSESGDTDLNSTGRSASATLASGRRFARFPWSVAVARNEISYAGRTDQRDSTNATLGYRIDRKWRVDGKLGYEKFDLATARTSTTGVTYSGTLYWNPNPRTRAEAEYGHRYFGTFWRAHGEHRSKRTAYTLDMRREVTNVNNLLIRQATNLEAFALGRIEDITSADPNADSNVLIGLASNEDFLITQVSAGVAVTGRRSSVTATANWYQREYEVSPIQEDILGLTLRGSRRLGGGIAANARVSWQDVQSNTSGGSQYLQFGVGASRAFGRYSRLALDLSRQQRSTDGGGADFTEHRIGLTLTTRMF